LRYQQALRDRLKLNKTNTCSHKDTKNTKEMHKFYVFVRAKQMFTIKKLSVLSAFVAGIFVIKCISNSISNSFLVRCPLPVYCYHWALNKKRYIQTGRLQDKKMPAHFTGLLNPKGLKSFKTEK
jgi:hypothetical protein